MSAPTPTGTPGTEEVGHASPVAAARPRASNALLVVLGLVVVLVMVAGYVVINRTGPAQRQQNQQGQQAGSQLRASGLPSTVPTSLAYLMGLSTLPAKAAPGFTLTDQAGKTVSLASLRGHAVVLEFMDPNCTDICPIVSQEFIDAYKDLGVAASHVVFIAVNVNPFHVDVASMATYSREHQLNSLPSWHFLTGPVSALQSVWHDYGVAVSAPNATADVVHTSVAYFIDPSGVERFVAFPMVDHTSAGTAYCPAGPLAEWGHGIALVTRSLS